MEFSRPPGAAGVAWLAATTLGVAMAWVGLRPVLDTAVPDRAAPLSAADVRRLAVPSTPALRVPGGAVGPSGRPAGSGGPSGSATASPGRPSASKARSASATSPAPTVVDGWTVTTQSDGTVSYLRSFQVPGGSTVVRVVPGRVYLVSATPNPAYSVQTSQEDPTRLVVQFTATGRYDIVDAMWWNSAPNAQVSSVG